MYQSEMSSAERSASTVGAVLVAAPIILMFARLGDMEIVPYLSNHTQLIDVIEAAPLPPPPPPPPPTKVEVRMKAPGAPAKKAIATEMVAPPAKMVIPTFQPIVAAPVPNKGAAAVSGAVEAAKTDGTGAAGGGKGAGGGVNRSARPVMLRGVTYSDYPMDLQALWPSGTKVVTRLKVGTGGKVEDCEIVSGVGNGSVDRQTCRLLKFKGRFKPAMNEAGKPVEAWFDYAVMGLRAPEPSFRRRR